MTQISPNGQQRKLEKFYRLREVESLISIRKSSIYAGMKAGTFPAPVRLSARAVAWRESDIATWQAQRQQTGGAEQQAARPAGSAIKGTSEEWAQRIAAPCAGNSRLVFALACAFAGPLLRSSGGTTFGVHFYGDSSTGKTTALRVAASVYGGPGYMQSWHATGRALEALAVLHSDGLLILDELGWMAPKKAGECAYMLANEQNSPSKTCTPSAPQPWRMIFLSSGERSLADHIQRATKQAETEHEMPRVADIPADAGRGMGAFENLHDHEGGAKFSDYLREQAGSVYGATGRAWLQWLTDNADTIKPRIRAASNALALQIVPEAAGGQVQRMGARFALVGAAGELATAAGLTSWAAGESERAALECFSAWQAQRQQTGGAQ